MTNPLISMDDAKQLLKCNTYETQLIAVVSDYYNDDVLQHYSHLNPTVDFALLKTEHLEIDSVWTLKPARELLAILLSVGLRPDTKNHILLFDNIQFFCGPITTRFDASARLFAVLRYFGFSKISIVFDVNISTKFSDLVVFQQNEPSEVHKPVAPDCCLPKHTDTFVNYAKLSQILSGGLGPYHLLDARSEKEFTGVATGYDYVPLAGKIPTAENVINGDFQTTDNECVGSMLDRLESTLTAKNIAKNDRIIWYCGTAWRASRMFALTLALGYTRVSIYDGGWNEWQKLHPEDGVGDFCLP